MEYSKTTILENFSISMTGPVTKVAEGVMYSEMLDQDRI